MNKLTLGWQNPRPNDFQTEDLRPLRDLFGNLQKFMTWPHVRLSVNANFNIGAGLAVSVDWTLELDDPYALHQGTSAEIQVPRDFDSWLAIGVAAMTSNFGGGAGQRRLSWRLGGVDTPWITAAHFGAAGVRLACPLIHPVSKGEVLDVAILNQSAGVDSTNANATLFFLPFV